MSIRTPKYRISWPLTASQMYNIDAMFQEIYADLGTGAAIPSTAVIPGTYGSGLQIPQFTVNKTGNLTFAGNVPIGAIPAAAGTLTGTTLAPNVIFSSLTTLGILSSLTVSGGAETPITFIASVAANSTNTTSVSATMVTTGANFLVAFVMDYSVHAATTLTDSAGNTWIALPSYVCTPTTGRGRIIYAQNAIVSASHTFTAQIDGVITCFPSIRVYAFSGIAISALDQQAGSTLDSSSVFPGSITPANSRELVFTGASFANASVPSIQTPDPLAANVTFTSGNANSFSNAASYAIQTAPIVTNPLWLDGSGLGPAVIATFFAAPPVGGINGTLVTTAQPNITSIGPLTSLTVLGPIIGTLTGSATSVPGTGITGTVLATNVVTSSLTSVGTLATLTVTATINGSISGNAATVTTNANLTGVITSVGNATSIGAQTGTGSTFVVQTTPTLITPIIGVASGTSLVLSSNMGALAIGTTLNALQSMAVFTGAIVATAANVYSSLNASAQLIPPSNSSATYGGVVVLCQLVPALAVTMAGTTFAVSGTISNQGTGSGLVSNVTGVVGAVTQAGTNPITNVIGLNSLCAVTSSGGVADLFGVSVSVSNFGAGVIAASFGLFVNSPASTGPITANYGGRINNQGRSGVTNAYGFNILEATGASSTNVSLCIGAVPTAVSYSLYNASTVASLFKGSIFNTVAECDLSYTIATPATLATVTMNAGQRRVIINPAGTIAVLTVTLPSSPVDGQITGISFTQIVSALTVNAPAGATVVQSPTSAAVDTNYRFIYQASSTSWFPAA
jgi:hypothetical protein